MRRALGMVRLGSACGFLVPCALAAQSPPSASCTASATSLTPSTWRAPAQSAQRPPAPGLRVVATIPLPGPTNRFDYQSFDAGGRFVASRADAARNRNSHRRFRRPRGDGHLQCGNPC